MYGTSAEEALNRGILPTVGIWAMGATRAAALSGQSILPVGDERPNEFKKDVAIADTSEQFVWFLHRVVTACGVWRPHNGLGISGRLDELLDDDVLKDAPLGR